MTRALHLLALASAVSASARTAVVLESTRLRGGASDAPSSLLDARAQLGQWWSSARVSASAGAPAAADGDRLKALSLMRGNRRLSDCEKAVQLLRSSHSRYPEDATIKMELADALNAVMRIKTNANALIIEGMLDTPANKRVWKVLGAEALPLAKAAYKELYPKEVKALAVYADSFMFAACAKGLAKQALTGTAKEYKRLANELRKHPSCDSAVGCIFLGGLYNTAPWPVGNKEEAKKLLGEAAKRAPKSRRNLYYCGVNAYQMEDYKTAQDWFQKALKAKCASPTEADFGQFMIDQSKRGLALSVAALKK